MRLEIEERAPLVVTLKSLGVVVVVVVNFVVLLVFLLMLLFLADYFSSKAGIGVEVGVELEAVNGQTALIGDEVELEGGGVLLEVLVVLLRLIVVFFNG